MNNMKSNLGWIVAGVLGGVLIFSGFGQAQEKFGVVNLGRMVAESKLGKRNTESLTAAYNSREALLAFMGDYMIISEDQAGRLKAIALKNPMSEADKKEEELVKNQVKADQKLFDDLNKKIPPTDEERLQISQFNKRGSETQKRLGAWSKEFQAELAALQSEVNKAERTNAKAALDEVAKKGGYSVILDLQFAPYGANDVTDEGIKALDAKTN